MKAKLRNKMLAVVLAVSLTFSGSATMVSQAAAAKSETKSRVELTDWSKNSQAAASIERYVKKVTNKKSKDYIPVKDRIVVIDLDGTMIGELYPAYFEYMMFIHRALNDPTYQGPADMIEFARALSEGIRTGNWPDHHETLHAKYAGMAYMGMTPGQLKAYTKEFMKSKADGFTNLTRGQAFYKPMVSMVKYLAANDFTCYIVTGSDRNIARAVIDGVLPIPPNHVIGMSYTQVATGQGDTDGLEYVYSPDDNVVSGGELVIKTIKMNKVSAIALEIGKVPVLSFGNSSGDTSMAQYVVNNKKYKTKAYMVCCDDLSREHGNLKKANDMRMTCLSRGFEPISMKDDFGTIYGKNVKIVPYGYDEH